MVLPLTLSHISSVVLDIVKSAAYTIDFSPTQANYSNTTSETYNAWLRQRTSAHHNVMQYLDTANLIVYRQQAVLLAIRIAAALGKTWPHNHAYAAVEFA
jgi:hypothetical protein